MTAQNHLATYGQTAGQIEADLYTAATGQVQKAQWGVTLQSIASEPHPNDMYTGPANNLGAMYRAAYWQAVGSRIVQARNQTSTPLTMAAVASLGKAGTSTTGRWINPLYWFYSPHGEGDIGRILNDAAARLRSHDVPEIAAILERAATKQAIKARQKQVEGLTTRERWVDPALQTLSPVPTWAQTWWFKGGIFAFGTLLLLGLAAWAFKPYAALGTEAARAYRRR